MSSVFRFTWLFASIHLSEGAHSFAHTAEQTFQHWGKNKDGKLVLDELPAGARANFGQGDTDSGDFISSKEHAAYLKRRSGGRNARRRGRWSNRIRLPFAVKE